MQQLAGVGIWSHELRYGDPDGAASAAAELESLGYSALWVSDVGGALFDDLDRLLAATSTVTIATGILNVWAHAPEDLLAWWDTLSDAHRGRLLIGLGVSHAALIGDQWGRPLATMTAYLDALEAGGFPLDQVCLAALGPKMIALAGERTAGVHPYFVNADHTKSTRDALGADPLVAVELAVVLTENIPAGRELARPMVTGYGGLPNYANNWRRLGFTTEQIEAGDDAIVDDLIAIGDLDAIRGRIQEQFGAGADHVCIQVIAEPGTDFPLEQWRRLAPAPVTGGEGN
jgi:probable F420-dependent oxidoreductase